MSRLKIRTSALAFAAMLLLGTLPGRAQKNKNNNKKNDPPAGSGSDLFSTPKPVIAPSDTASVDRAIGEALGYWQIGDVDSLHKYYSDDVTVVSGDFTAPVIGWENYVKAYQAQRSRVSSGRMERSNTFIKVNGTTAWATYQFVFTAIVEGRPAEFRGHTTLVFNKVADRWLITLNHSSVVDTATLNPVPVPQPGASPPQRP